MRALTKKHLPMQFPYLTLVGIGGTGSYLAQGVAKMAAGYKLDTLITLVDPDTVEEKNCARQNFLYDEIGENKALALAYRLNQQYGLAIRGVNQSDAVFLGHKRSQEHYSELIVTCVDNIKTRKAYQNSGPWLDLGNGVTSGQAIYGNTGKMDWVKKELEEWDKTPQTANLPNPYLVAGMINLNDPKKKAPSCGETPFAEQGIYANEWAAQAGLCILHQLLIIGTLTTPALYFDCATGRMLPQLITKEFLQGAI